MIDAKPHVFVVDDIPTNRAILSRVLTDYDVTTASSGRELFEALHAGVGPDLILLDVLMPDEDGFGVCRRLKADAAWRAIPVIFITALDSPEDETRGLAAGAVDYVSKPFVADVVRARVRTHLALAEATRNLETVNRNLERQVSERSEQLRDAYRRVEEASHETIIRLSRAAEHRDEDTGAHVVRMGYYAAAIARPLGLGERAAQLLLRAAPMHDIGKIGVPDRVLLKPGALDREEFEIVKTHTEFGARILAGSQAEVIRLAETVALSHHERWDGAGYPHGLVGEEIPLQARIVAVADTFDALVSRRPYKEPMSIDASFDLVRKRNGTAFDPAVVEAFFSVQSEILDVLATYRDVTASPLFRLEQSLQAPLPDPRPIPTVVA